MQRISREGALRVLMEELHRTLYELYEKKPEPYRYNIHNPDMGLKISLVHLSRFFRIPRDKRGIIGVALDRLVQEGKIDMVKLSRRARWIRYVKPPEDNGN